MANFNQFNLSAPLLQSLERLNFTTPTPIQAATIPIALVGRDILGSAQTGTGKTGAFGIPLIEKLLSDKQSSALVLTPTRELASQVLLALQNLLGRNSPIKTSLLIGGDSMMKQLGQLRLKPRLFVGTPGRINDHLERGTLNLSQVNFLVLDETDRMLDMGFSIQIERIIKFMSKKRQTLLFSATLPKDIVKIADSYLDNPERVAVGSTSTPIQKIKQEVVHTSESEKYSKLLGQLDARTGSIIIFVKTKFGAEKMAKRLRDENHQTDAIHGDLRHTKRESVIRAFRNSKYRILVATDIAARGLDIPHIAHVINYDLPQCPEDYIHRIGRTARAGAEGEALCFVTSEDRGKWNAINRLMNPSAAPEKFSSDRPARKKSSGGFRGNSSRGNGERNSFGRGGASRTSDGRNSSANDTGAKKSFGFKKSFKSSGGFKKRTGGRQKAA
ncbi:MAG: DEAD/DEAH box helicase [Rickettsiales bacterium]|nr:MAG: DEAD/DEAH box helicase [Rickettsiales bacterium]